MVDDRTFEVDPTLGEGGWYRARCECGWNVAPFPGIEDAVDALMDHAYLEGMDDKPLVPPAPPEGPQREGA
jgi:hypothetical protein